MSAPPVAETELGVERQCNSCLEWWPLDAEFFYRQPNGFLGFQGMCKACRGERRGRSGGSRQGSRTRVDEDRIQGMLALGRPVTEIASLVGVCPNTVYRRARALSASPFRQRVASTTIGA